MPINNESLPHARRCVLLFVLILWLPSVAQAQSVADEALSKARSGQVEEAVQLYTRALSEQPDNVAILRDYAAVLGSAGKYSDALPLVRKAISLSPIQPEWARREFAGIYLFGDAVPEALEALEALIRDGDNSEQTLNRRGLALRWLGRSSEAAEAYRSMLKIYSNSEEAAIGLAYSLADRENFSAALAELKASSPQTTKARIRILNWAGRHYEAREELGKLPPSLSDDREVLEDQVAAARWGGDPAGAVRYVERLVSLHPGSDSSELSQDLHLEYGQGATPAYRFSRDNFGLTERSISTDFTIHATASQAFQVGYQYRWFDQAGDSPRTLVRYSMGWSGNLNRRLSAYASAATVDYREPGLGKKLAGDFSLSAGLNDNVRIGGGGGRIVMDAYPALHSQVTAPFAFGEISTRFRTRIELRARYSQFSFSNNVKRDRADLQFRSGVFATSKAKLYAGWRLSGLWHDRQTSDFWSPERFHSNLAFADIGGRIAKWLEYAGEVAVGIQSERGSETQYPLQVSGKIAARPSPHWRAVVEIGRSTSSVDRSLPGQRPYSRWFTAAGLELRLP